MALHQLQNFVGKSSLPLIVNGKLLMHEGRVVRVATQNGHIVYFTFINGTKNLIREKVDIVTARGDEFKKDFIGMYRDDSLFELSRFFIDKFSGAIMISCQAYETLNTTLRTPAPLTSHSKGIQTYVRRFISQAIEDYTTIYLELFDRRIGSSKMPMSFKGHLIGGLYKPVILDSQGVKSPITFGIFAPLLAKLNQTVTTGLGNAVTLERLEWGSISSLEFRFECISAADYSKITGAINIMNLSRRDFIICLNAALMNIVAPDRVSAVLSFNKRRVLSALAFARLQVQPRNELQRGYIRLARFLASTISFVQQTL